MFHLHFGRLCYVVVVSLSFHSLYHAKLSFVYFFMNTGSLVFNKCAICHEFGICTSIDYKCNNKKVKTMFDVSLGKEYFTDIENLSNMKQFLIKMKDDYNIILGMMSMKHHVPADTLLEDINFLMEKK